MANTFFILSSPERGFYVSQIIQNARACSKYAILYFKIDGILTKGCVIQRLLKIVTQEVLQWLRCPWGSSFQNDRQHSILRLSHFSQSPNETASYKCKHECIFIIIMYMGVFTEFLHDIWSHLGVFVCSGVRNYSHGEFSKFRFALIRLLHKITRKINIS